MNTSLGYSGSGSRLKTSAFAFFPGLRAILYWYALRFNDKCCSCADAIGGIGLFSPNNCFVIRENGELSLGQYVVEFLQSKMKQRDTVLQRDRGSR